MSTGAFRFEYAPGAIRYGRGCAERLGSELARCDAANALVVTGTTVGTTRSVIDPVRAGIGDRLAGVFAETTPEKRIDTVLDGVKRFRETDADAIVSLGGGSSLDVATAMLALADDDRTRETIRSEFETTQMLSLGDGELPPLVAVPTTLAGADLSVAAGITTETADGVVHGGLFDRTLMPEALCYDPALIETTPPAVLYASAMNGFDKGIESLYARGSTPITDATATHGLELLADGLPALGDGARDDRTLHDAITGTILVQYGVSRADGSTLSVIHAFGHGITKGYDVQQGAAHGIVAPHVLRALFEHVDGNRDRLASALGVEQTAQSPADAVVHTVTEIRDALGLPGRLREIEDMTEEDLPAVAETVATDGLLSNTPSGFDCSRTEIETILENAW